MRLAPLALLFLASSSTDAFSFPQTIAHKTVAAVQSIAPQRHHDHDSDQGLISTTTLRSTKNSQEVPPVNDVSYGELSRRYRRTVYSHDDWVVHRSPDRFLRNILSTAKSGIYQNVSREVLINMSIATIICLWNAFAGGYTDFSGVVHDPIIAGLPLCQLSMTPFTLASPFLGLILVFRTNAAYKRWDEARKNWGMNINHTRDLVRMGNAFYDVTGIDPKQRKKDLERLSLCTWAFVRAMKRHLSPESEDEQDFRAELYAKLPESQAAKIIQAAHRPNRALQDLSLAVENLPMHFLRKDCMHEAITIFEDNLGSSERLLTSPVPIFYNRHTARFLSFWLLTLPLALYEPFSSTWNHFGMIPATAMLSLFMYGIEELATQMEEPFTILPMQAFCDKIYNWCNEIVSFEDGDNGIRTRRSYQGHTAAYFEEGTSVVAGRSS